MNERIKALMGQTLDEKFAGTWSTMDMQDLTKFAEKFAELIVRECSKVIVNGGYRNPALSEKHPLTPPEIAQMIKEHFGVE